MTRGRVAQLASAGPPPERAFFGTDALTVVLGKSEAPKRSGPAGPTVSQEGFRAYQHLKELCATLSLDAGYEFIPPPGMLRLNRDNLVVICGPRLSPLLAQVLEADPVLSFADDDDGWHIADKMTGTAYRSPIDDGKPQDIGYLARLPWPGCPGPTARAPSCTSPGSTPSDPTASCTTSASTWLTSTARCAPAGFSMLISCEFDPGTREIITSDRLTAPAAARGQLAVEVSLATSPGAAGRPNEDFAAATSTVAVVLDGVTQRSGLGTGCVHDAPWYVAQLGTRLLAQAALPLDDSLAGALALSIEEVAALHSTTCDLTHPGSPSAAVAVLRERDSTIDYLVLADCVLLADGPGGLHLISDDRIEHVAEGRKQATEQEPTGSPGHSRLMRQLVTERQQHRNQPEATG